MKRPIQLCGIIALSVLFAVSCESTLSPGSDSADTLESEQNRKNRVTVGSNAKSLGPVTVGTDASEWDSETEADEENGIYPIGGGGQVNGEFTIAERNGVQIGLRAQKRFVGTIEASGDRVGVYESTTGFSSGTRAVWNYDWHVDLRGAKGRLAGKTLGDYDLTLETNIADELFGADIPMDLTFGSLENGVLYQGSWNPDFGNDTFDPTVEDTYTFRLILTPKTFRGAPLAVQIRVNVTEQE